MQSLGRSRCGEKTPRHVFRIEDILSVWPDAKVVCLIRDPRAVVASYRDWKRGKTGDGTPDRSRAIRSFHPALHAFLVKGALATSEQARRLHGSDQVLLLRYEDLVADPEASVRGLAEWVGRVQKGSYLEPTKQTVAEYLAAWLEGAKRDLRPSSVPGYEVIINTYLVPNIGALPL